jgi:site-specific recombinase XerD
MTNRPRKLLDAVRETIRIKHSSPRTKDVDFEKRQIIVRAGKGDKDRMTMLPDAVVPFLQEHH